MAAEPSTSPAPPLSAVDRPLTTQHPPLTANHGLGEGNAAPANASTIEAWNTVLFEKFWRFQDILTAGLGQHGEELFRRFPPPRGGRVLDVGCGLGDTTVRLAKLVGDAGVAVGLDCARNFVAASRARAAAEEVSNVDYLLADAQIDPLGGPYDAAYSRFGTMFFDTPVAALRNLRAALRPGALLAMSVWRKREDNPCFHIAEQVVARFIAASEKDTDQVTCGPGPFSMAGADLVSDQLIAAGFQDIGFMRFDAPMCVGRTLDEALEFAREVGPAGESLRLAAARASERGEAIESALREALSAHLEPHGVWATSSTWLITARAP